MKTQAQISIIGNELLGGNEKYIVEFILELNKKQLKELLDKSKMNRVEVQI